MKALEGEFGKRDDFGARACRSFERVQPTSDVGRLVHVRALLHEGNLHPLKVLQFAAVVLGSATATVTPCSTRWARSGQAVLNALKRGREKRETETCAPALRAGI